MSEKLEQGLYSILTSNSPQTAAGSRVYPYLPQGVTFPCITYERVSTTRNQSINANVGVTETVVMVEMGAESYSAVKTLADEVRTILHGYSGAWSTLTCHNVVLADEYEAREQEGDRVTHWVTHMYRIWTNMD